MVRIPQRKANIRSLTGENQPSLLSHELARDRAGVRHVHITVLGTGFSGLGMAIQLKRHGYKDFIMIERAADLGGNWRDNTYPGAASNVPAHLYSYSFAPNPDWSCIYPSQAEIYGYMRACAERFGILPCIEWNTELLSASWDEEGQFWLLNTTRGQFTTDIFISGNGQLDEPFYPSIPGLESFEGTLFHSARWRHDCDLTGKRVAVIGTGPSAFQFVPQIQPLVEQLSVFQRTASWLVPLRNCSISARRRAMFRSLPLLQRLERIKCYIHNEMLAQIMSLKLAQHPRVLAWEIQSARRYLEEEVTDPVLRARLLPQSPLGCGKFWSAGEDFYRSLGQPNVEVITAPIVEIRAHSLVSGDGQEREVDAIICGTGFHVTDTEFPMRLCGRGGQILGEQIYTGFYAYLGTTVAGFPNLFFLCGPGTSLPHNSMINIAEAQINYILDCLRTMERQKIQAVEVQARYHKLFTTEMLQRNRKMRRGRNCPPSASNHEVPTWPGLATEFWFRTHRFDARHYHLYPRRQESSSPEKRGTIPLPGEVAPLQV